MEDTIQIYKALAEIDDILLHSDEELTNKIPQSFKDFLRDKKDYDYTVNIDYTKDIDAQNLLLETQEILALIYTDYLCSEEERVGIITNNLEVQQEMVQKYSMLNIFEPRDKYNIANTEEVLPVKYEKRKWYEKILYKILNFFKRKNNITTV